MYMPVPLADLDHSIQENGVKKEKKAMLYNKYITRLLLNTNIFIVTQCTTSDYPKNVDL